MKKEIHSTSSGSTMYLLPNYDEYTIAFKERELFFNPEISKGLPPVGKATSFAHIIVKDGKIIGLYRREVKKDAVHIISQFFKQSTKAEKEGLQKKEYLCKKYYQEKQVKKNN